MNMKKQILSIIFGAIVLAFLLGTLQAQPVTLTFTGQDAASQYIQLDMVSVTNVTRGWQEYLFWNDTVLVMDNQIGIHEVETRHGASLQMCHGASLQTKFTTNRPFQIGDQMEYVGYAIINGEDCESPIIT